MDRTEYELRKLVLMVGTQRAFVIMREVEKAVCPPPTEDLLKSPSDNEGNVIHAPFGKSNRGRQASSDGPSAMLERFFSVYPNGGCSEFIRYAQGIKPDLSKGSLTTTYYKKYKQYQAA